MAALILVILLHGTLQVPSAWAQEIVAGRPPMYARLERARAWLSPISYASLRLHLDGGSEYEEHELEGVGLSLGGDFVVQRHLMFWINGHVGAITGAEVKSEEVSGRLSRVNGSYGTAAGGAAGLLSTGKWNGLLGLGLFFAAAEWEGREKETLTDVSTSGNVAGLVAMLRGDYTLRNGFFVGLGVDAGAGIAGGSAARGAGDPTGDWVVVYLPLGWTY